MTRIIQRLNADLQPIYMAEGSDDEIYSAMIGGVGWPHGDKPGSIVVLGQDVSTDRMSGQRPVWVLAEMREDAGEPFFLPETMFTAMTALAARLMVNRWFGMPCPFGRERAAHNRQMQARRLPAVSVCTPSCGPDMYYLSTLIRRRLVRNAGLFFGRGDGVQATLRSLPADVSGMDLESLPDVTALSMALAGLERATAAGPAAHLHRPADRVAGY